METSNFWFPSLYISKKQKVREKAENKKKLVSWRSLFPPLPLSSISQRIRYILQTQTVWDWDLPECRKPAPSARPGCLHPGVIRPLCPHFPACCTQKQLYQMPITDIQNCGFPTLVRDSSMKAWVEAPEFKENRGEGGGKPLLQPPRFLLPREPLLCQEAQNGRLSQGLAPGVAEAHWGWGRGRELRTRWGQRNHFQGMKPMVKNIGP